MARITVEDCLTQETNRFGLVLLAAKRTKQLLAKAKPLVETKGNKFVVTALREIAAGHVRFMTAEEERLEREKEAREREERQRAAEIAAAAAREAAALAAATARIEAAQPPVLEAATGEGLSGGEEDVSSGGDEAAEEEPAIADNF